LLDFLSRFKRSFEEQLWFDCFVTNCQCRAVRMFKHCVTKHDVNNRYEWRKNGVMLDPLPNLIFIGNGTIHFSPLTTLDEGYYQCYAFNDHGTTMSSVAVLRRALITSNPPMDVKEYKVT